MMELYSLYLNKMFSDKKTQIVDKVDFYGQFGS